MPINEEYLNYPNREIRLESGYTLSIERILKAMLRTNRKFAELKSKTEEMEINIFEAIDFRMLSGLVGETLVTELSSEFSGLEKNPNIDGYPDLVDVSKAHFRSDFDQWRANNQGRFIKYPHSGIEVKNTFGTKKAKAELLPGQQRILF